MERANRDCAKLLDRLMVERRRETFCVTFLFDVADKRKYEDAMPDLT
jgi:hypothetical protein